MNHDGEYALTRAALALYHEEDERAEGKSFNFDWSDFTAWLAELLNKAAFSSRELSIIANWRDADLDPNRVADAIYEVVRRRRMRGEDIPTDLRYYAVVLRRKGLHKNRTCELCGVEIETGVRTSRGYLCFTCAQAIGEV